MMASTTGSEGLPAASPRRAWYAVGVLLVAYIFSIMDRQILTLLVGPIQKSLGVNDTLIGLLHGFTFAAFYGVMGLPIARLIDRGNRRLVIAVGIAIWSLATAAGGLATDYWHLLIARVAVAVGEAVLVPGTVSLLADLFTAEKRGRAMGIFGAAGAMGSGLGLIAGSLILAAYTVHQPALPLLGAIEPWQATFIAVGLPGVIVAIFMWWVPEPRAMKKGAGAGRSDVTTAASVPVSQVVRYIAQNSKTVTAFLVGAGFFYMIVYGYAGWAPTYFVRHFGWKYAEIGKIFGLLLTVVGPFSALFGSWLGERWRSRGVANAYMRVAVLAVVGVTLSSCAIVLVPTAPLAVACLGVTCFFSFFLFGVGPAIVAQITPGPMRGQMAALYTGGLNLLGAGCGPVAIGVLTDYAVRDPARIGTSMLAVFASAGVVALLLFRRGLRSYAATLASAADWRWVPTVGDSQKGAFMWREFDQRTTGAQRSDVLAPE